MTSKSILVALAVLTMIAVPATAEAPENDDRVDAVPITSVPFSQVVDNRDATVEADEPIIVCGSGIAATVWYRFEPATPLSVKINTTGSDFDTVIAVYEDRGDGLEAVACSDDAGTGTLSSLWFQPAAGAVYYIQAGGYDAFDGAPDTGSLRLNLDQDPVDYARHTERVVINTVARCVYGITFPEAPGCV